ncbi:MAG: hypothetical protein LUE89_11825 [Clostridiales bacterium]|nr:hypothetical protein [Clostridiales bacterium]
MYRVRKDWNTASTQLGAYEVLANAVAVVDENPDYIVFDENGNTVYKAFFRVRKSWNDEDSQLGAFSVYANATALVDKNDGYKVYDYLGVPRYPVPFMVSLTSSTAYYTATDGVTKAGTAKKGTYTITEVKSPYGYLKSGVGWLNLTDLDVYTAKKTPLELAAANVADVYESCLGCKHVSGSYTWPTAMKDKKVNCSIPATRVAVLAGILPDGKRISHKAAASGDILKTKTTIAKSMTGYNNLDLTKCAVTYVGAKNYAALPSKYKVKGAFYIQDSNIAVCGGDGIIYACHNWAEQMTAGKGTYTEVALTSGYTKNSPILVVVLPNS